MELNETIGNWGIEDRSNLAAILGLEDGHVTAEQICNQIKWLYHSRAGAKVESTFKALTGKVGNWRHPFRPESQNRAASRCRQTGSPVAMR